MYYILHHIFSCKSKLGIPVGVTNEMFVDYCKINFSRNPKGLYITTVSDADNKEFNNTMSFIQDNFRLRDHTQKEMWLIGLEFINEMIMKQRYLSLVLVYNTL